jgi:single-stranded-DNA-specific exonuclease
MEKLSFTGKQWINPQNQDANASLEDRLLSLRGISSSQEKRDFFGTVALSNPFEMKGMPEAVDLIQNAISEGKKIRIIGDYDTDGVVGTSILHWGLSSLGAESSYTIPHRHNNGYGITQTLVDQALKDGIEVLITVDNGISARDPIAYARQKGLEVIVSDHHLPPAELPDAVILNPQQEDCSYPDPRLCGAGVVYQLLRALFADKFSDTELQKAFGTLVGIATVSDMVPLLGENRQLVKNSLENEYSDIPISIQKLLDYSKQKPDSIRSDTWGFQIGPRINAAGRLPERYDADFEQYPNLAIEMLVRGEGKFIDAVNDLNEERKASVRSALKDPDLVSQIEQQQNEACLILVSSAPSGVVGLLASEVMLQTGKPVLCFTREEGRLKGSGRSPDFLHLKDALDEVSHHLDTYGGHAQAAGMTISDRFFERFKDDFKTLIRSRLSDRVLQPTLPLDSQLASRDITKDVFDLVERFEPTGQGNPKPTFFSDGAVFDSLRTVGTSNAHLQGSVIFEEGKKLPFIGFRLGSLIEQLQKDVQYQVAYTLQRSFDDALQLNLLDVREI